MRKYIEVLLLGAALTLPAALPAQERERTDPGQSRRYEDRAHHDQHEWNEEEDREYRRYLQEHHRKYKEFDKTNRRDQEAYWKWRHDHPHEH